MKRVERILIKIAIIQGCLFLLVQIFFHHFDLFPGIKEIIFYEGVNNQNHEEIIEAIQLP